MRLHDILERDFPGRGVLLVVAVLAAAVFALDAELDPSIGTSIFYLLPVAFAAWYGSRGLGLVTAVICAALWFSNDVFPRLGGHFYSNAAIPYWNAAIRGGYFTIISLLLSRLRGLLRDYSRLSKLKSEMISYVSHEFGNQLGILSLGLTALAGPSHPEEEAHRGRALESMIRVLVTLKRSIANFLNAARLESGKFSLHLERSDLRALMVDVLKTLEPLIENKHLVLRSDLPQEPVMARVDPDALSLVLSNLIGNAVKYTKPGGRIAIGVAVDAGGESATLSVEDSGVGIPDGEMGNIFAGFYRAPGAAASAKGFGAGLKVSKDLLESHGARLQVSSRPGDGSRFYFSLPLLR